MLATHNNLKQEVATTDNGVIVAPNYIPQVIVTSSPNAGVSTNVGPTMQQYASPDDDGIDCSPCCNNGNIRRTFQIICLGQVLSICLCGTGVASEILQKQDIRTPAAQSFLSYFFLSCVYSTLLICRKDGETFFSIFLKRGWKYFILSFLDVQANYIIVYAYQFTNLTSIQLLDCATIPTVLLLSCLFLSARYLVTHIIGVMVCLIGIAMLIWADVLEGKGLSGGSNRLLGDILCIIGSILYAIGNVCEEYLVKQNNRIEYLGMVSLFSSIISGIQLAITEHRELANVRWSSKIIAIYLLFAFCMFIFYSLVTIVMQKSSALMFNLSIQTADFYTLMFGLFVFNYKFQALYFLSFFTILIGSIVYSFYETERGERSEFCRIFSSCGLDSDDASTNGSYYTSPMVSIPTIASTTTTNSPIPFDHSYCASNMRLNTPSCYVPQKYAIAEDKI